VRSEIIFSVFIVDLPPNPLTFRMKFVGEHIELTVYRNWVGPLKAEDLMTAEEYPRFLIAR
jgi:hypothetical protein